MPERHGYPLERLESALLAAAITPGLRSILLFDAAGPVLEAAASALEQMLLIGTGRAVVRRYLGAAQHEDDLWIRPDLSSEDGRLVVTLRPGTLMGNLDPSQLQLVVIPDLVELSLAAARGCVALIGADVAHLERHGASLQWLPNGCWLAACDRAAIGKVSPHLLDRFAVRFDAGWTVSANERVRDIRRWALGAPVSEAPLYTQATDRLREAMAVRPDILPEMLDRILDILPSGEGSSPRRDIALARLAVAYARLAEPDRPVGRRHVDQAATLVGLPSPAISEPDNPLIDMEKASSTEEHVPPNSAVSPTASTEPASQDDSAVTAPMEQVVLAADPPELFEQAQLPDQHSGPYPEDQAIRERDVTALREGPIRSRSTTVPRGSIIGVQQTRTVQDLALLNTILTAAIWQPYRRMHAVHGVEGNQLRLLPTDLRSYRRAPAPDQLLVLVVDYTCLEGWDWTAPLLPYLRWAYVERAGIVLVRVGAQDSPVETRADRLATRNLLDPRLDLALNARPGRSTPLAHGLFLALQALRHALQHGEGSVRRARLVIVTDGRGNIPLEVDSNLNVVGAVGRAGIEDALEVAASIRMISAVESFLIDPEPALHAELVWELAHALGAELVRRRPREAAEDVKAT
jgi:magnesium chelatase subunit D